MDDFVIFQNDKNILWWVRTQISDYLATLHLCLHQNKCRIFKTAHGVPFLGLLIFPDHRRLKRENIHRFKRKLKRFQKLYAEGRIAWEKINQSVQSWIGHAKHADSGRLRKFLLEEAIFQQRKGD